ncbi:MAG: P-loop domain-containing protein, partial [Spirochaetales bacterium]
RMQELVAKQDEPITPFIDKVRQLSEELDVSTVLVLGGSGDYFDVADEVIAMQEYRPARVTDSARRIAEKHRTERQPEGGSSFGLRRARAPQPKSIDPRKGKFDAKTKAFGVRAIQFGVHEIDLQSVEQLVCESQTRAIAEALLLARSQIDGERTLAQLLRWVETQVSEHGLDVLSRNRPADLARFRTAELASAMNRLRSLAVTQRPARENISLFPESSKE